MTATMGRVHFKDQGYQVSGLRLLKIQKTNSFPNYEFFSFRTRANDGI